MATEWTRRRFVGGVATGLAAGATFASFTGPLAGRAAAAVGRASTLTALPPPAAPASFPNAAPLALRPFPMRQVRLRPGPFQAARDANRDYLRRLPTDRLAHMFRLTAGLPSTAQPFGGWEAPNVELRGHFTGGHFLSACALQYAGAGDDQAKAQGDALVAALAACQKAHGNGYLSAFPEALFDKLRAGQPVWAPFYTLHKIMAGHFDMYRLTGNEQALETCERMAAWTRRWVDPLSDGEMQRVLQVEYGGMGEVLFNLAMATGRRGYLELGHRFDKRVFFDPLLAHRDDLQGLHANTHIPQVIGAARAYEADGSLDSRKIAEYFQREVTSERTYCTGGTSNNEHWEGAPGHLRVGGSSEECCCGYNMLKLTRHIHGWTGDPRLMDYYERTLFNSRLGTENEQGMKMYYVPLAAGYWKIFSTPFDSFWCCTGTGAEEFGKFNDSIYFHDDRGLYVNLYIASDLEWPERGLRARQETSVPAQPGTTLTLRLDRPTTMDLNFRVPYWTAPGGSARVNGEELAAFASPGSYLRITREWRDGDRVELRLPMRAHLAPLPGQEDLSAVMYGPLVLAAQLGADGITPERNFGDFRPPALAVPPPEVAGDPLAALEATDQPLTFKLATAAGGPATLRPLSATFGQRYAVYWRTRSQGASA